MTALEGESLSDRRRRVIAARLAELELIQYGRTDLVEQVMRGEMTAQQALGRGRTAKRKARVARNDDDD
ncbi:hypothetical protein [Mycobacterium avium]|uniref:hypothetical protein n=1 Tax=Mycobacterium avium TaxID=1764 RepID=UPI001CC7599C|nr:hypothetical protein [Mycobacterium avium]